MRTTKFIFLTFCVLSSLTFLGYAQTNSCEPIEIKDKPADLTYKIILSYKGEEITAITICAYDKNKKSYDLDHVPSLFQKDALIRLLIIENEGEKRSDKNKYSFDISSEDAAMEPIYVYIGGEMKPSPGGGPEKPNFYIREDVPLEKAGQKYSIKITRYNSLDEKLRREKGKVIFDNSVRTYHRFSIGLNAGLFLPISYYAKTYSLFYANPSVSTEDVRPIIRRRKYWNPRAIVFLSYYPGGFEPERKGHFQINAGTELSSSIMGSIYIGVGYARKYYSINIFGGYFTEKVLSDNYSKNQVIQNKNIDSVPLIDHGRLSVGLTVAVPFSIAGVFGKLIGL